MVEINYEKEVRKFNQGKKVDIVKSGDQYRVRIDGIITGVGPTEYAAWLDAYNEQEGLD